MKAPNAFREFKVENAIYTELSKDEKQALPILKDATAVAADIYLEQRQDHDIYLGAGFYPTNITDSQIEKEAQKNPQIFSPYTVVEKTASGIRAIPYHLKYKTKLQKIAKLLTQAAEIVKNKELSDYLKTAGKSLLSGDYKKMDIAWLKTENSRLQFLIGPYERYLDRRFFKKMTYMAFVGVKDSYYSRKAEEMSNILLSATGEKPHRYTSPRQIQICTIHNIIFAGIIADALLSTEHIPSDDQTIRELGSRLIGYLSSMDFKFDNLLHPIFKSIFQDKFKQSYPENLLRRANYYLLLVYGLARQLHRYEGSRERLKELFPVFDEASSIIAGIQHSKHLILKGVIDQKDLEAMIIMHICWCFSEWISAKTSLVRTDYMRGDALSLNFLFQNGALRQSGGISWPNFSKIFFTIESLSTIFINILSEGSYEDADKFLRENLSYEIFKAFESKLSRIRFN